MANKKEAVEKTDKPTKEAVKKTEETAKKETKAVEKKDDKLPFVMPELVTMLQAGIHFGHERSKRNPKMEKYIFMQRNKVAIFDLELTAECLEKAAKFAHKIAQVPSNEILFVGTKRQSRNIVKKYADACGQPYVTKRWLGGTLTNFSTILKSIEKLEELQAAAESDEKITKKARAVRSKEIERLADVLEGIKNMRSLPAAIFVIGSHDERLAVKEAKRVGIPVIGITDTNADPEAVDYPIPGNDDAVRALDMIVGTITKAILAARKQSLEVIAELAIKSQVPKEVVEEEKEESSEETKEKAAA